MLNRAHIAQNLYGAWLIMTGRREGLNFLDVSTDGFWRSFVAPIIGVPAILASCFSSAKWSSLVSELSSTQYVVRAFLVEVIAWVLPILALALVAKRLGLAHRFSSYVVAANWSNLIVYYLVLPLDFLGVFLAQDNGVILGLSALYVVAAIIFLFLVTHISLGTDYPVSIAVFLGTVVFTLFVIFNLQGLLGLS